MPAALFREKIDREAGRPGAWDAMQESVRALLRELLAAAAPHVAGGRAFARGRALYGVDVMFTRDLKPKLLEVTFCPGVERPMAADPDFLNKARRGPARREQARPATMIAMCACVCGDLLVDDDEIRRVFV